MRRKKLKTAFNARGENTKRFRVGFGCGRCRGDGLVGGRSRHHGSGNRSPTGTFGMTGRCVTGVGAVDWAKMGDFFRVWWVWFGICWVGIVEVMCCVLAGL